MRSILGAVVLGGMFAAAPAAHAQGVTNPAEHPAPVAVTIDGHAYHDGRDTLPGYDDELCTPIPNVQYDFAGDQIQYYDGDGELLDTAHWTEWDRISSYQTWRAQQNPGPGSATPTPAPTSAAPTSPASASPTPTTPAATKNPSTKSTTGKSPSTTPAARQRPSAKNTAGKRPSTNDAGRSTPAQSPSSHSTTASRARHTASSSGEKHAAPTGNAAAPPTASGAPSGGAPTAAGALVAASSNGAAPSPTVAATSPKPAPATTTKFKLASATVGPPNTRLAGAGILLALFALGCLGLVFGEFRHQVFGRPRPKAPPW